MLPILGDEPKKWCRQASKKKFPIFIIEKPRVSISDIARV